MRVLSAARLRVFWESHADAEEPLRAWFADAEQAVWESPHDLTAHYTGVSILGNKRVCFNIKGNTYRLIVAVDFRTKFVLVKWIGTHAEYDRIDAETVGGS